jgi:hypothetical protein
MAMYPFFNSSLRSSLFFFFKGLRFQGTSLAGDDMNGTENSQLPLLRQNTIVRPLGKTEDENRQINQVPAVRKHKELERRKTPSPIWSNSAICLQRMRSKVFIQLASQTLFIFVCNQQEIY